MKKEQIIVTITYDADKRKGRAIEDALINVIHPWLDDELILDLEIQIDEKEKDHG